MKGKPFFYGTSSKFSKSILKSGLSTKIQVGEPHHLRGLNLTTSVPKALFQANKAVMKFGGTRLIVVCDISSKHPVGESDLRSYILDFGGDDPSVLLHEIQTRDVNLDELVNERISLLKEAGANPSLISLLKDKKRLIASLIVNYLAYKLSKDVESKDSLPLYYPSLVFVLRKGKPVFSLGRPVLKYPSEKWLASFKRDMGRLTKLIGAVSTRLTRDESSVRVKRVGLKGPDKVVAVFEEVELHSNLFDPVYVAPGYYNYAKLFLKKLSRYIHPVSERMKDLSRDMETRLKEKFGL